MPIDWDKLKPQMTDLALEHICRRCKRIIPGRDRIAGPAGNYHIQCYEEMQQEP